MTSRWPSLSLVLEQVREEVGVEFRVQAVVLPGEQRGDFPAHDHFQRAIRVTNPFEQAFTNLRRIVLGMEEKGAAGEAIVATVEM